MPKHTDADTTRIIIERRAAQRWYMIALDRFGFGTPQQSFALQIMHAADEAYRVISHARAASGLCCVMHSNAIVFPCSNPIDPSADCHVCTTCQDAEDSRQGACDGRAAARRDHQADE